MTPPAIKLLHITPWAQPIGGVETLLTRHAQTDAAGGLSARQLALFDKNTGWRRHNYETLAFSWRSTPATMRRAMAQACAKQAGSVVVYHGAWSVPWFADIDASSRRILFLHDSINRYAKMLPTFAGLADGLLCDSESTRQGLLQRIPWLTPDRVAVPPAPITLPVDATPTRPQRDEWVIGHAGRLVRPHKAAHRLVPFVREAKRLGLKLRVEVMGDGPLRNYLTRKFRHDPTVQFIGWQSPADYWRRLQSWDVIVSFSEHEGGPITLLEGMAAGAIPLYPQIGGSLGDDYAPQIDARCYYPAGDPCAAARALQMLQATPFEQIQQMRRRAQQLMRPHENDEYEKVFAGFIRRIAVLPRISCEATGMRKPRFADRLPLGFITRVWPGALQR